MSKCKRCGYQTSRVIGRPRVIDDKKVLRLRRKGKSLAEVAEQLGVTRSAIQAAIKRS